MRTEELAAMPAVDGWISTGKWFIRDDHDDDDDDGGGGGGVRALAGIACWNPLGGAAA